ncbi:hypothetical protein J3Q09_25735 [Pseudomonas sp. R4-83]|uniref:hypothetical protein n=1 Tax=unclassified Pseudomonas TaxID=196821 RepID=UPI003DA87CD7
MKKADDEVHPDQVTLLAILALGSEEIDRGNYAGAEAIFIELDALDSDQKSNSRKLEP